MTEFLICYDISDPKRLGRVHRYLKKRALPVQYSVFLFSGSDLQLVRCLEDMEKLIDVRADDLRAYPIPARGLKARLGRSSLPEGIQLGSLPAPW